MTSEDLKATLRSIPAGPFTVHLEERTPIEALHTDYAMLSPGGQTLLVWDTERMHWLNVRSITRLSCKRPMEQAG